MERFRLRAVDNNAHNRSILMADYEAPAILELGSVADFTQGRGIRGDADSIFFLGHEFSWGQDPAS